MESVCPVCTVYGVSLFDVLFSNSIGHAHSNLRVTCPAAFAKAEQNFGKFRTKMSFSRAAFKRFNEHVVNVKFKLATYYWLLFLAAEAALLPSSPSGNVFVSPVRGTLSADGLNDCSSAKRERSGMTLERKQQKLLEREINSLVQQRGEQDRRLQVLEEELKKVEARLLTAVREKTGLNASVITLERQRAELTKVKFLKAKVSADTTKKRINSLTMELMEARNNLDAKNQELSLLQINTESQLKALESDLETARATASALSDKNKELEDLHHVAKAQGEDLENENARLNVVMQELREDIRVLQGYLDEANDQIQDLRLKIKEMTQESAVADARIQELK
nr:hyaluronan mediated motility receptor-like [Nothobranchius furzeri]